MAHNGGEAHSVRTALIYTRVSSEEQGREGLSLPAQLANCRRYCATQGWVIGAEFTDVMSGKRDDRPGYQALLAEAKASGRLRSVVLVTPWLHRLGRRLKERVRCWEDCKALGIPIHSALEGGEQSELV